MTKARPAAGGGRWVEISPERLPAWLDGFYGRHGGATENGLTLTGTDNGDTATLYPPPGLDGVPTIDELLVNLRRPLPRIALLLARKGAVAVGIVDGTTVTVSKVERHYVQGRTAAGGSSQARYARRRANQTDAAAQRAVAVAARVLLPYLPGTPGDRGGPVDPATALGTLVCGGDRSMVDAVLSDRRLSSLLPLRHPRLLEAAEPRLAVLQEAAVAARRVRIHLVP